MAEYVSFLRGINVGGRNIKMSDLRDCVSKVNGIDNVETILQSGNLKFGSNLKAENIKKILSEALSEQFKYDAKLQVISIEKLKQIVISYSFKSNQNIQDYIVFMENGLNMQIYDEFSEMDSPEDNIAMGDDVVYWQVPYGRTLKSAFSKLLTRSKYKDGNTIRNLRTVNKLLENKS